MNETESQAGPWRVLAFVAPGLTLAAVSRFLALDPDGWRLEAGLWEQAGERGIWRLHLHDSILLYCPLFAAEDEPPGRRLPRRPFSLVEAPPLLAADGLDIGASDVLAADGWTAAQADAGDYDGFLGLRLACRAEESWGRRELTLELYGLGALLGPEQDVVFRAAEAALGLRRTRLVV